MEHLKVVSKIYQGYDGWRIEISGRSYHWDHNEPDLGVGALSVLLRDLGFDVELIEDF